MDKSPSTLAIIPARGGSKGIPRKCLCHVGQKPILQRAIETAHKSKSIQRVIVSTDDEEFAKLAKQWGAEVPFLRPAELATDNSSTIDAVCHLYENISFPQSDYTVLIQPTTPLLIAEDIDKSFNKLVETTEIDALTSVCESEINPDWMRRQDNQGWLTPVVKLDIPQHRPRQEMPLTYRLNGAFFWIKTSVLLKQKTFLPKKTVPYVMPQERSVDIDCEFDLKIADYICSTLL